MAVDEGDGAHAAAAAALAYYAVHSPITPACVTLSAGVSVPKLTSGAPLLYNGSVHARRLGGARWQRS